jgi:hypothetical protein
MKIEHVEQKKSNLKTKHVKRLVLKKETKTCTRKRINSKVNVHLQKSHGMVKKRIDS